MSADETAGFHERSGNVAELLVQPAGLLKYSWIIFGGPLVLVLGALFIPFLLRLPRRLALQFALAGFVYVMGAVGVEVVGGTIFEQLGVNSWPYLISVFIEEGLEFIGVSLFLTFLLLHLARDRTTVRIEIS
jgi:hypothetical protein